MSSSTLSETRTLNLPLSGEWDQVFQLAGEYVGWSGAGPPVEFTSNLAVEADDEEEATRRAVLQVEQSLLAEDLTGWVISADEAWSESAQVADTEEMGYDPGPPENDD